MKDANLNGTGKTKEIMKNPGKIPWAERAEKSVGALLHSRSGTAAHQKWHAVQSGGRVRPGRQKNSGHGQSLYHWIGSNAGQPAFYSRVSEQHSRARRAQKCFRRHRDFHADIGGAEKN